MKVLALESSTKGFSLALAKGKTILAEVTHDDKRMVDQAIVPAIDALLSEQKMILDDVDVLVVDQGPGSFTGLRVGMSTIKGLAFGRQFKVVAVSSLMAIAHHYAQEHNGHVCVITDARRSLVYQGSFRCANQIAQPLDEYKLLSINDVLKDIKTETIFLGDAVPLYQDTIKQTLADKASFADEKYVHPHARHVHAAALRLIEQEKWQDPMTLTPLYLYAEDCQIKQKK